MQTRDLEFFKELVISLKVFKEKGCLIFPWYEIYLNTVHIYIIWCPSSVTAINRDLEGILGNELSGISYIYNNHLYLPIHLLSLDLISMTLKCFNLLYIVQCTWLFLCQITRLHSTF